MAKKYDLSFGAALGIERNREKARFISNLGRDVFCPVPPHMRKRWVEGFVAFMRIKRNFEMDISYWVQMATGEFIDWNMMDEYGAAVVVNFIRSFSPEYDRDWAQWAHDFRVNQKILREFHETFGSRYHCEYEGGGWADDSY